MNQKERYQTPMADMIKATIFSPDEIKTMSHGEIKNAETINYRTFKPEKGGLFCEKIFGPSRDWECSCGKYKKIKYKGVICERCGVEVTESKVRRERMAHIELAVPVAHIWFSKSMPSQISNVLGLTNKAVDEVIYYESYIVIDPGTTDLQKNAILTESEHREATERFGSGAFSAKMGAEAIKDLLAATNLEAEMTVLKSKLQSTNSEQLRKKLAKRLKIIEAFLHSGNQPEWMILDNLPVIPPELRPLVPLDGGRFATSDLNDLYRRVINRNSRLKSILKHHTPSVIIRNEMRMLQNAVDALFDNAKGPQPVLGAGNRPLKSFSCGIKGKSGRFRQNLLGKRVDYSGRSVIVVGPELKLNQCGLPKEMALTLFEPFIIRWLKDRGLVLTIPTAKKMIQNKDSIVWDALDDMVKDHPVMLNRAPTLHRLGIQAFEPVLIEGKAIRIHPLVCSAFNADFDGDQMAVHVPLSVEAQAEVKLLMMACDNIFLPQSGKPVVTPSQDMVLGLYYLMIDPLYDPEKHGKKVKIFSSPDEVIQALECADTTMINELNENRIDSRHRGPFLHEKIKLRVDGSIIETTYGRVIFNQVVPKELGFQNYPLPKKKIGSLIKECYKKVGLEETVNFLDRVKDLGFAESTRAAVSMGLVDVCTLKQKPALIAEAEKAVKKIRDQHAKGVITNDEKSHKLISIWNSTTDRLADDLIEEIKKPIADPCDPMRSLQNPIFIMMDSGARGTKAQIKQLGGMRGLMAKPGGGIAESPVIANFREGLSVLEYYTSSHGARKGLADTALKTADSGYLTRRLVDVAQDVIVSEMDCGTLNGIDMTSIDRGGEVMFALKDRIAGRFTINDICEPGDNSKVLAKADTMITEEQAENIDLAQVEHVKVRSALTCESKRGCCAKCYGLNLSTGKIVGMGEAVGIIAAQSIGEPGTQLTMRTFHLGGIAGGGSAVAAVVEDDDSMVIYNELRTVEVDGKHKVLDRRGSLCLVKRDGNKSIEEYKALISKGSIKAETFALEPGNLILVKDGDMPKKGTKLVEGDFNASHILTARGGFVKFVDLIESLTLQTITNKQTGKTEKHVKQMSNNELSPVIAIYEDKEFKKHLGNIAIPSGAILSISEGDEVEAGATLAKVPREASKAKDITGGLPRVAELFEARQPKDPACIARIDGIVEVGGVAKGHRRIVIRDEKSGAEEEQFVPATKQLIVQQGDFVSKGDQLNEGVVPPQDILEICGVSELQHYLVNQVQEVYRMQGVDINDKHIEVIIHQMLQKVRITDSGDTTMISGEVIHKKRFLENNRRVVDEGGTAARAEPVLLGITKASLGTESFISAASFQQTGQVLTQAVCAGAIDYLIEPKSCLITGNMPLLGTGFKQRRTEEEMRIEEEKRELDLTFLEA